MKEKPIIPDYCPPPGVDVLDFLEEYNISQKEFAARTELTEETISKIVNGTAPITPETARKFAMVLGAPASYWINRESQYRQYLHELALRKNEEDGKARAFVQGFPYDELVSRGACPAATSDAEKREYLLLFFGVVGEEAFAHTYGDYIRGSAMVKNTDSWNSKAFAAWLRLGELAAQKLREVRAFEKSALRAALHSFQELMNLSPDEAWPRIVSILGEAGVVAVRIEEFADAPVHGFTRFISPSKGLLQLSLHRDNPGAFWFALFHEICHLLNHSKKRHFINRAGMVSSNIEPQEDQANRFASHLIIPSTVRKWLKKSPTKAAELMAQLQLPQQVLQYAAEHVPQGAPNR